IASGGAVREPPLFAGDRDSESLDVTCTGFGFAAAMAYAAFLWWAFGITLGSAILWNCDLWCGISLVLGGRTRAIRHSASVGDCVFGSDRGLTRICGGYVFCLEGGNRPNLHSVCDR